MIYVAYMLHFNRVIYDTDHYHVPRTFVYVLKHVDILASSLLHIPNTNNMQGIGLFAAVVLAINIFGDNDKIHG